MEAFDLAALIEEHQKSDRPYLEFIRHSALSVGLYMLPAGGVDRQTPHEEDEVYYVISGNGVINVKGEDRAVRPGSTIYVAPGAEHFFHLITEDLLILVLFAPAEGS